MKFWDLEPGQRVKLGFADGDEQIAEVVSKIGDGEDRRITLRSDDSSRSGETFEWEAYRYKQRWSYGSSADRLVLLAVLPAPTAE